MPGTEVIEEVEVVGEDGRTIGLSGGYVDKAIEHSSGRTGNAIADGRRYLVEVTDGVITDILIDYHRQAVRERKEVEQARTRQLAEDLAAADTYGIVWAGDFHDHTTDLTPEDRTLFVKQFLRDAPDLIESSDARNEFALLVTDPKGKTGSGARRWRLCGRVDRVTSRRVYLYLWHYGPGSQH
ncbi:hypothetical protein QEZ54_07555 [Catellatospora sp. KI3]|uniref:hypothetical protein n=1 Tax=Catellatospora sp. KI3 TaxID=3041620 RepID=UPI002482B7FB|nr:hypothetical protein [Catellatospora sp. KI3]MDI1460816.1 hypothetical protein [Catellatospora sp. KI3]